jgi:hypothetical protein
MSAIGFRVKSGFAVAVVLDGSRQSPAAIARRVVELSDPDVAETRQPYHHGFYNTEEDPRELARRVRIVKRCAARAVDALLADTGARRATLIVGSVIDPSTVGNQHIRAHAHEGRLFRTVLEQALASHGVECDVIVEQHLARRAAADLGRTAAALARTVTAFGKSLGPPWRADEKAAATAAWLALR